MIRVLHSEQQHSQLSAVLLWLFYLQLKETQTSKSHNNIQRLHSDARGLRRFLINRVLVLTCGKVERCFLLQKIFRKSTNGLWWCEAGDSTWGQDLSLWICLSEVRAQASTSTGKRSRKPLILPYQSHRLTITNTEVQQTNVCTSLY